MKKFLLFFFTIFLMSGCVLLGRSLNVEISGNCNKLEYDSYAILPFADKRILKTNLEYNAADAMTDAFETEFIGAGFKVVDRRNIDKALDEMQFAHQGDVDPDQRREIGKLTNSDVLIIGKIRTFQNALYKNKDKPEKPSKCTTISFSVKAVHVETGQILWKGSLTKSTGFKDDFLFACDCDVLQYADQAANDLVEKIVKKLNQKKSL